MQTKSEMINRIAELAKENVEIKTSYINFIAKLKREMITKDDIQDLKDTAKRVVEECNSLRNENAELKAENERLKEEFRIESLTDKTTGETIYRSNLVNKYRIILQEIMVIAEENKDTAQYGGICKSILDLITKAESEEK